MNEVVVIAAALADADTRAQLARRLQPDHFLVDEHRATWAVLQEMVRRGLGYDPATFRTLSAGRVDASYVSTLAELRPDLPPNLEHHVGNVLWDRQRASAAKGPVAALLEALRNTREQPDRVRALARQVASSFDGAGDRANLHEPGELVSGHMAEVRRRVAGHACFPFGVDGLDVDESGRRRLLPGAAPGMVTVVTGVSGSGKSTFTAHLTLGLARAKRRVLYGAWEMGGGMTLELLACISLGWSRAELIEGKISAAQQVELEERMHAIARWVTFMRNPFKRDVRDRADNDRNLDVLQGILADAGCEVFVADLWKRCLRDASPEAEEDALYRQQAMLADMGIHGILLQQQRMKDIEQRADKRPTREGIKGSSTWVEIADNIFGTHRPAQWKSVADDRFQAIILKQRYAPWPLAVEFEWDGDRGRIWGGRTIQYDQPGEGMLEDSGPAFVSPKGGKKH
jgi:replicative DNA helicase